MEFEKEITIEINTDLATLIQILENNGFTLKETYDLNDIYMIHQNEKENDYLSMLSKCVLIRHIIEKDHEKKMLTYKYKEYNEKKEIIRQGKVNCEIDDVEKAKLLLEHLNFEELISIKDHLLVYATDQDELVIQNVNGKHIYIEIEEHCNYANKTYQTIEEMKDVIKKYAIPIKENNFFVKKAEIELQETYGVEA